MKIFKSIFYTTIFALIVSTGKAEISDPVGFNKIIIQSDTDIRFSIPFERETVFEGSVVSGSNDTITLSEALNDDFGGGGFYLKILSSGEFSTITAAFSGSNTIQVEELGFADGINGEACKIVRHHTLESFLPSHLEGISFVASDVNTGEQNTLIIAFGLNAEVTNVFAFFDISGVYTGWYDVLNGEFANDYVLRPHVHYLLRNQLASGSSAPQLELYTSGKVDLGQVSTFVDVDGSQNNLLFLSSRFPTVTQVQDLNLPESGAFVSTVDNGGQIVIGDWLIIYDNGIAGFGQAPTKILVYVDIPGFLVGWYDLMANEEANDVEIMPSSGLIFGKSPGTPGIVNWFTPSLY